MPPPLARRLALAALLSLVDGPRRHGLALAARSGARRAHSGAARDVDDGQEDADGPESGPADAADGAGGAGSEDAQGADQGGLDIGRLQQSLKDGGVDGLNNMLKAFQAMGSASASNLAAHIKKDADGNEVYDFRDLDAPASASTPAPGSPLQPPLAAVAQTEPVSTPAPDSSLQPQPVAQTQPAGTSEAQPATTASTGTRAAAAAAKMAPRRAAAAKTAPAATRRAARARDRALRARVRAKSARHASAHAKPASVVPASGIAEPAGTAPAAPGRKEVAAPPTVPEGGASRPASGSAEAVKQPAPVVAVEQSAPAVAAGGGELEVPNLPAKATLAAASAGGSDRLAAIEHGLEEVRRGVDTLVTLGLHDRSEGAQQASGQHSAEMAQLLGHLEVLERENAELQAELRAQAERLRAVEAFEHKEDGRLGEVARENEELRGQLHKLRWQGSLLSRGARGAARHGHRGVRTFTHSKGKTA